MENRPYRKEDIRYYESDSSSSGFSGFHLGTETPPRSPSPPPPPPPIRSNIDHLPSEELTAAELSARIRRGIEERIAYWNARPTDTPMRRPMRAPGRLENYVDVDQLDFPERLVHDGPGLRDTGFRKLAEAGADGADPGDDDDDDDEAERALWDEEREMIKERKRARRRKYKENCRARGKSTSKKKKGSTSVASEQPEETEPPLSAEYIEEDWELEITQQAAELDVNDKPPEADMKEAPEDMNNQSSEVEMNEAPTSVSLQENIDGSYQLLEQHAEFMQELRDTYGDPEPASELAVFPSKPSSSAATLAAPFPAINEPAAPVVEATQVASSAPSAPSPDQDVAAELAEALSVLASVSVGPLLADVDPAPAQVDEPVAVTPLPYGLDVDPAPAQVDEPVAVTPLPYGLVVVPEEEDKAGLTAGSSSTEPEPAPEGDVASVEIVGGSSSPATEEVMVSAEVEPGRGSASSLSASLPNEPPNCPIVVIEGFPPGSYSPSPPQEDKDSAEVETGRDLAAPLSASPPPEDKDSAEVETGRDLAAPLSAPLLSDPSLCPVVVIECLPPDADGVDTIAEVMEVETSSVDDRAVVAAAVQGSPAVPAVVAKDEAEPKENNAAEENMEIDKTEPEAPDLMDVEVPQDLPPPPLVPDQPIPVAHSTPTPSPTATPDVSPRPSPPGSPRPCAPSPPPAPAGNVEEAPAPNVVENEIPANNDRPEANNDRPEAANANHEQRGHHGRRERQARQERGRPRERQRDRDRLRHQQPLPRPRPGDRWDRRRPPPPHPVLPTWGHVNQEELLRAQRNGGRVGKLKTRRRRQSRARKLLREQGVDPELIYYRYEWRQGNRRRRP